MVRGGFGHLIFLISEDTMEKSSRRYIVTNSTIKEPRLGPGGKDVRKLQEKNGYVVQFRDSIGNVRMVTPKKWGGNPVMVSDLTEGLFDMYHKGLIDIEEIDDISTTLKKHTLKQPISTNEPRAVVEERVAEVRASEGIPAPTPAPFKKKAKAVEMGGSPSEKEKNQETYPGAINPDGKDNFTVIAPRGKKGNQST